jgi:hypothetical protein
MVAKSSSSRADRESPSLGGTSHKGKRLYRQWMNGGSMRSEWGKAINL